MFDESEIQAHARRIRAVSQAGKGIVAYRLFGAAAALNVDDGDQAFMPADFAVGLNDNLLRQVGTPASLLEREEAEREAMIYLGGAAGESIALENWRRYDQTRGYRYAQVPLFRADPRAGDLELMHWRHYLYWRIERHVFPEKSTRLVVVLAERLDAEGQLAPSEVASEIDGLLRSQKTSTI